MEECIKQSLIDICYPIIGCMHEVHQEIGPGLPEYVYQEALYIILGERGFQPKKEYAHHPMFHGQKMKSAVRMDLVVPLNENILIVECKSIQEITHKEQFQLFGYMRATGFPIGILVNFGTFPKAQIQRYYYNNDTKTVEAF